VNPRTTYGELVGQVAWYVAEASRLTATGPALGHVEGLDAMAAYFDFLRAVTRHGWALLGGDHRMLGDAATRQADPATAAAVRLLDRLHQATSRAPRLGPEATPAGRLAGCWHEAARRLAAAGDLLATHRGPDGQHRSPQAWLLDEPDVRAAGLGQLAQLAGATTATSTGLGLRLLQARVYVPAPRRLARVPNLMPDIDRLRHLCEPGDARLAELELARPSVRGDDPVRELADRLARLHRAAWQSTREPHIGVGTLADYAALGVMLHAHTAALLTAVPACDRAPVGDLRSALASTRDQWRHLARQLDDLRTATPASPSIRADLRGVQRLLRQLVPMPPAQSGPIDRHTATVVLGAIRTLPEIAGWNAHTFSDLVATRQVYAAGIRLTGDEVTDHDDLVAAKLGDGLARIPTRRLLAVRDSYAELRRSSPVATPWVSGGLVAGEGPRRRHELGH
jgi:hypothetical protein